MNREQWIAHLTLMGFRPGTNECYGGAHVGVIPPDAEMRTADTNATDFMFMAVPSVSYPPHGSYRSPVRQHLFFMDNWDEIPTDQFEYLYETFLRDCS